MRIRSALAAVTLLAAGPLAWSWASASMPVDDEMLAEIDAAREGLAAYLDANKPAAPTAPRHVPGCPTVELERLDEALADALAEGDLGDPRDDPAGDGTAGWGLDGWGATVDWGEYRDLGSDVMGVTCAADVDGETRDADRELAVEVTAVDLGDEDRYPELLNHVAFGALDDEPADVPGGSLDSVCDVADYGSYCLSLWQHDGFVVGVLVASTVVEIPAGTSSLMIADLLDDVFVALAAQVEVIAAATEPESDESIGDATELDRTDAARAGLERLLAATFDTGLNEPLAPCSVLGAAALNRAMETAGHDAPISPFLQEVGSLLDADDWAGTRAVTCTGSHVGIGDESFPELTVIVTVADLGSTAVVADYLDDAYPESTSAEVLNVPRSAEIEGETIGFCGQVDRTDRCRVFWADDGFLVGIDIADRVYTDHTTTAAVLVAIVPHVLDNLARA